MGESGLKKVLIIIVVLVAVVAGGAFAFKMVNSSTDSTQNASDVASDASASNEISQDATITYSENGYSPERLVVKSGTKVTIKNASSKDMEFDSDPHPSHTNNKELNEDLVEAGKAQTFVVNKTGTFGYHNHLNASETGTIVVK